jgi:hypothetical protein
MQKACLLQTQQPRLQQTAKSRPILRNRPITRKLAQRQLSPHAIDIHLSRPVSLDFIPFALFASQCDPTFLIAFAEPSPKNGCYQRERMQNREQDLGYLGPNEKINVCP